MRDFDLESLERRVRAEVEAICKALPAATPGDRWRALRRPAPISGAWWGRLLGSLERVVRRLGAGRRERHGP